MGVSGSKSDFLMDGFCDKKYETVKEHLSKMLRDGAEENVQLCVYVDEKCVVDLYGTAIGDKNYNAETVQTIYSSGKSIESIAMAMLYGKGLFKYEDSVAKHWPEFGQNGKENVKICDVFRHQSGLSWFTETIPSVQDAWIESIKENKIGALIENQKQHFPKKGKTEYHAQTRGLIINELVRRLDAKGRTISEILQEDVKIKGIYLGASTEAGSNPTSQKMISKSFILIQSMTPEWLGKKIEVKFYDTMKKALGFSKTLSQLSKQPPFFGELQGIGVASQEFIDFYNSPDTAKAQVPSVNFRGNARGCAKLASIMANKGQGLMSEEAWEEMHSEPELGIYGGSTKESQFHYNFTKGGVNYFKNSADATKIDKNYFNKNREGYYGWFGYGGSIMQWHPKLKIGFAFIPTFLNITEPFNNRGAVLQQIVKDCAES